jgi:hypothetical protein
MVLKNNAKKVTILHSPFTINCFLNVITLDLSKNFNQKNNKLDKN